MQKIFNWTVGSFFRSIGRIIAYVFIGGFIAYLLHSTTDIRLADLLGIQTVKATDFSSGYTDAYYFNIDRTNILTTHGAPTGDYYGYEYIYTDGVSRYILSYYNNFYFKTNITTSNQTNIMYIPVYMISLSGTEVHYSLSAYIHDSRDNKYYSCERISYASNTEVYSTLKCPFRKGAVIDKIETYAVFENKNSLDNARYYLNRYYTLEYEDDVQAIIDSQHETTNAVNSINQTISDTNSTSESSSASDFFHDYNETAQDGIIAIVNMPLNIFNALTLGSTEDLCFTLKGKQVCLPSGNIIWGKSSRTSIKSGNATYTPHPFSSGGDISSGITIFKTLFNLVVGGYLCYKMLRSLMRITNDMLSPTKDKLEVLEL